MANKVKYGLKNVYYAIATDTNGVITYGIPAAIPGAVSLSLSRIGDKTVFVADDYEYFVSRARNGFDGTLELAIIPDTFKVAAMGEELDSDDVQFEKSTAQPVSFALMFQFTGDSAGIKHLLYKCTATRSSVEGTTTNNKELKTETLNLRARKYDGAYAHAFTKSTTNPTTYAAWTSAVHTYNTIVNTPVAAPVAGEVASGTDVVLTCATPDATIYYTDDGNAPTESSTEYTTAIDVAAPVTIKAKAFKTGFTASGVLTAAYTLTA